MARWQNKLQVFFKSLNKALLGFHSFLQKKPLTSIFFFLFFLFLCTSNLSQFKMLLNIDEMIDPDFSTYEELHELKNHFLDKDEIIFIVRKPGHSFLNQEELCSVRAWIQRTADSYEGLKGILATTSLLKAKETSTTFSFRPVIDLDCTKLSKDQSSALEKGRKMLEKSVWRGTLTSQKVDDVVVLVYPFLSEKDSLFGRFNHKVVSDLKESFQKDILDSHKQLKMILIGDGVFQFHLRTGYEFMTVLNLIMSLLIVILFRIFLGTFKSSFIFLTLMSWISLFVYSFMTFAGHPLDVLSSSLSLMILVSSLEDFIFLSILSKRQGPFLAFKTLMLPSLLTSLTTVIGFGSLMLADLEIVRRFGFWAAISGILEWIILFLIFPVFVKKFHFLQTWCNDKKTLIFIPENLFKTFPKPIFSLCLLFVFPLSLFSMKHLYISDSPERLLSPSHPTRKGLDVVEATRGWRATVSLVFKSHDERQKNLALLEEVKTWTEVVQIEDYYSTLNEVSEGLTNFGKGYTESLMKRNSLFRERLGPHQDLSRALLYVKSLDIEDTNLMRQKVDKLCPNKECWLAGSLVSYGELGQRALMSFYKSLIGSLVLVSCVLFILCLTFRPSSFFPLLLSAMWGPVALICFFYIFNIPVFYITSMVASIVVGIAGDNAIQFLLFNPNEPKKDQASSHLHQGLSHLSPASFLITLCMVISSCVFFFGYFHPMKTLALMLISGFILSLFGDIWILKGLLSFKKSTKDKNFRFKIN